MRTVTSLLLGLFALSTYPALAAPQTARYIVLTLDRDGSVRAVKHDVVELTLPSWHEDEVVRFLAETPRETDRVALRMLGASGDVIYRAAVEVPRWIRSEHGLHGGEPQAEALYEPAEKAFVARLPYIPRTRLRLAVASVDGSGRRALSNPGPELDLDALATDATLPLASYRPEIAVSRAPLAPASNSANRLDLLVVGDGYTAAESQKFKDDVANIVDGNFFGISPYSLYRSFVKTTSLFVASSQSGADHPTYQASCSNPPACCSDPEMQTDPKRGTFVSTAFDATFCVSNIHRLLTVDTAKVLAAAAASPDWDKILAMVNDDTYGGAGGSISTFSTNAFAVGVAQHEFGHSYTALADEYTSPYPGFPACSDSGGVACEVNVTNVTDRNLIKWRSWILPSTPIPTSGDPNVVGLFQGARYLTSGMYRPKLNCLMNTLGQPFCEICTQAYILKLYRGWGGNPANGIDNIEPGSESPAPGTVSLALPGTKAFSVGLLAPDAGGLTATWLVDGVESGTGNAFTFQPSTAGTYTVQLKTKDGTALVRQDMASGALDHSRTWTVNVTGSGGGGSCVTGGVNLCLSANRFRATVSWQNQYAGTTGVGTAVGLTTDTGYFWFFDSANVELVAKILDGRAVNGKFWVFYGALSDVGYTITITDTVTGTVKTYVNPPGTLASVADINAL